MARYEEEPENERKDEIYDEEERDNMVEDGEITPEEDAFMDGYEEASHGKRDRHNSEELEEDEPLPKKKKKGADPEDR